ILMKHDNQSNHEHHDHIMPMESPREYMKFAAVILGILAVSVILAIIRGGGLMSFMTNFMAVFFLVFGLFKLVNLQMFVLTYRSYDMLAKKIKFWGWVFPFVEIVLGLGYLLLGNLVWLNLATI